MNNSLLLPLVMRSNRTILKYFVTYESTISCLKFHGSKGTGTLEKTKHGTWFLTEVLVKVIPNLDNLEACYDYLTDLGKNGVSERLKISHATYQLFFRGQTPTIWSKKRTLRLIGFSLLLSS